MKEIEDGDISLELRYAMMYGLSKILLPCRYYNNIIADIERLCSQTGLVKIYELGAGLAPLRSLRPDIIASDKYPVDATIDKLDVLTDALPQDGILVFSNMLHHFTAEEKNLILSKCNGCSILVREPLKNDITSYLMVIGSFVTGYTLLNIMRCPKIKFTTAITASFCLLIDGIISCSRL